MTSMVSRKRRRAATVIGPAVLGHRSARLRSSGETGGGRAAGSSTGMNCPSRRVAARAPATSRVRPKRTGYRSSP